MNDTSIDPSDAGEVDPHADKYNDPRAKLTKRGVLLGVLVVVLGIIGAAGSIYARRTRLEKTTKFWGQETITALQLGERIQMTSVAGREFKPVELTGTPGLGHLRHTLLDERSYDWETDGDQPISKHCTTDDPFCVLLRLTDPTANRFTPVELTLDLKNGWIGSADDSQSIRIAEGKRMAVRKFLEQLITVQRLRYEQRQREG